jgi:phosphoserine phosphatase RsbU/P
LTPASAASSSPPAAPPRLRVLLVEDNPGDATLIREALQDVKDREIELLWTDRVAGALAVLGRGAVDVVLLDRSLPDAKDLDWLTRISESAPDTAIVFFTAHANEAVAMRALQAGAQDYLIKGTADAPLILRSILYAIERKRSEVGERNRLKEMNRFKSELLNRVVHELNNPLSILSLQTHLLQTGAYGSLQPDQDRAMGRIERATKALAALVQELLEVARIQGGWIRLQVRTADLCELTRHAVDAHRDLAIRSGLELEENIPTHAELRMDDVRIEQVLNNLLSNAIKFSRPQGRILVRLEALPDQFTVRVTDSGFGLTPEQSERLFRPFVRVHENEPDAPPGNGLGLYICKGIIEAHGGRIWCESPGPGQGATFGFALPRSAPS